MLIEILELPPGVDIFEYTIREARLFEDDEDARRPYFQARLLNSTGYTITSAPCQIAYYNADEDFVGLDKYDILWDGEEMHQALALNMPLDPPPSALYAKFSMSLQQTEGFYSWAGRIIVVLLILLLCAWLFRVLGVVGS